MARPPNSLNLSKRLHALRERSGRLLILPLVLLVLAFAGATGYLGVRLLEERSTVFSLYRSGAWISAQLQMEHLRLLDRVRGFQAQPTAANRDEMMLRFEIFWSRFPVVLDSEQGRGLRSLEPLLSEIRDVFADLPTLEGELRALNPQRPETFGAAYDRLERYAEPIQDLTLKVLHHDYFDANSDRLSEVQREVTVTYLVLLLAGTLLIAGLVWQIGTAKRLARAAAQASQDANRAGSRLQHAIASISQGFLLLDRDRRVVLVNQRYYELVPPELRYFRVGDDMRDVIRRSAECGHYGDRTQAEALASRRIAQLETPGEGFEIVNPDGTHILVREYVTGDGGRVSLRTDITDLREAERDRLDLQARVFRAQKMEALGRLAGGIAHDFNNILMSVQGYANFLREDMKPGTPQHEYAEKIVRGSQRAAGLVQQILDFGRPSGGKRSEVRLDELAGETVNLLRGTVSSEIEISVVSEGPTPSVLANPAQLSQVLMNLCVNARDAIQEGGHAGTGRIGVRLYGMTTDGGRAGWLNDATGEVSLDAPMASEVGLDGVNRLWVGMLPPARYRVIEVTDNGAGMTAQTLERMFEPFYTTKRQDKGTGLGLAAVHGIVLGHGGAIAVESAPGWGTRVSVFLPAQAPGETAEVPRREDAPAGVGVPARLLLVDDEPDIADVARLALERRGKISIETVASAEAAVDRLAEGERFDLVVTDQNMPGMSGLELSWHIHRNHPEVAVLLMTGYAEGLDDEAARAAGALRLLHKPIDPAALTAAVADALSAKRAAA